MDSERLSDLLDLFHDGTVVRIEGHVPGDLKIRVQIEYLRHMYSEDGDSVDVTLCRCNHFSFQKCGSKTRSESLESFLALKPEIMSAKPDGGMVAVNYQDAEPEPDDDLSNMGTFWLDCERVELALDNGRATNFSELAEMSGDYWDNWRKKHQTSKPRSHRLHILWAIALALLLTLGAFCWLVVAPFLQTRSVVMRTASAALEEDAAIKQLGGPSRTINRLRLYGQAPEWLAPHGYSASSLYFAAIRQKIRGGGYTGYSHSQLIDELGTPFFEGKPYKDLYGTKYELQLSFAGPDATVQLDFLLINGVVSHAGWVHND